MIKNIIFDMYGVLIAEDPTCLMKAGFDEQTSNRLREVLYHSRWWNELDRGILPKEQIFRLIIEDTLEMEVEIRKAIPHMYDFTAPKPGAEDWVGRLQERGFSTFYLTNISEQVSMHNPEVVHLLEKIGEGVLSCKANLIKPNPEIYQHLLNKYHLRPEECVFIDDYRRNLPMAEHLGIHTIQYRTQEQAEAALEALIAQESEEQESA